MRIIAGTFRSRPLQAPPGLATRPTTDRLRETLFNVLAPRIKGAAFLDLYAGSGAVGLEAISRGAAHVTFLERAPAALKVLRANLSSLALTTGFKIHETSVTQFLRKPPGALFNLVFLDPPFNQGLVTPFCRLLELQHCLHAGSQVYIETELGWQDLQLPPAFVLYRETKAGVVHSFLTRYEPVDPPSAA